MTTFTVEILSAFFFNNTYLPLLIIIVIGYYLNTYNRSEYYSLDLTVNTSTPPIFPISLQFSPSWAFAIASMSSITILTNRKEFSQDIKTKIYI